MELSYLSTTEKHFVLFGLLILEHCGNISHIQAGATVPIYSYLKRYRGNFVQADVRCVRASPNSSK